MKTFKQYNESIRDQMTGPDIDVRDTILNSDKSGTYKLSIIGDNGFSDYFTKEELDKIKKDAAIEIIEDCESSLESGDFETMITFLVMTVDSKKILEILSNGGGDLMEILLEYYYPDYKSKYLEKNKASVTEQFLHLMRENVDQLAQNLGDMYEV
jgi:hypothetical protein